MSIMLWAGKINCSGAFANGERGCADSGWEPSLSAACTDGCFCGCAGSAVDGGHLCYDRQIAVNSSAASSTVQFSTTMFRADARGQLVRTPSKHLLQFTGLGPGVENVTLHPTVCNAVARHSGLQYKPTAVYFKDGRTEQTIFESKDGLTWKRVGAVPERYRGASGIGARPTEVALAVVGSAEQDLIFIARNDAEFALGYSRTRGRTWHHSPPQAAPTNPQMGTAHQVGAVLPKMVTMDDGRVLLVRW